MGMIENVTNNAYKQNGIGGGNYNRQFQLNNIYLSYYWIQTTVQGAKKRTMQITGLAVFVLMIAL